MQASPEMLQQLIEDHPRPLDAMKRLASVQMNIERLEGSASASDRQI